jgi:hypothetical protein
MISERIRSYADYRQQKDLNEIFSMLIEIGDRMIYKEYNNKDQYMLYEAVNQIAEDVLLAISNHPEHYIDNHNNFYPYYRYVLKGRMNKVLVKFYEFYKQIVCLDEYDEEALNYAEFTTPYDVLNKSDQFKFFVHRVFSRIRACPRFKYKASYLVWPMIASLFLENSSVLFDNLNFRDRIGLRVMLALVDNEKSHIVDII